MPFSTCCAAPPAAINLFPALDAAAGRTRTG